MISLRDLSRKDVVALVKYSAYVEIYGKKTNFIIIHQKNIQVRCTET